MTRDTESSVSKQNPDAGAALSFKHYPALIPTAPRLKEICKTSTLKPYDLFTIINADPVLTGITYGLYHEVFPETPRDFLGIPYIIIKLNINTVKNNALKAAARALLPEEAGKRIIKKQTDFLRRSLAAGIVSMLLAKRRGFVVSDTQKYYCAGLLHDIGGFVLSEGSGASFDDAESGGKPPLAGQLTAKLWGFPTLLYDAIAFREDYQHYSGDHADLVWHTALAVSVSDKWIAAKGAAKSRSKASAPGELFNRLSLNENILKEIEEPFRAEFKKVSAFIGLEEA
jgi:HD-like signal output (HDOD) protein